MGEYTPGTGLENAMPHPLLAMPGGAEWLIILAIVVLVFGAAKLPDLARSSGQALRIFKAETKELRASDKDERAGDVTDATVVDEAPQRRDDA